jgi:hypothetical protein
MQRQLLCQPKLVKTGKSNVKKGAIQGFICKSSKFDVRENGSLLALSYTYEMAKSSEVLLWNCCVFLPSQICFI